MEDFGCVPYFGDRLLYCFQSYFKRRKLREPLEPLSDSYLFGRFGKLLKNSWCLEYKLHGPKYEAWRQASPWLSYCGDPAELKPKTETKGIIVPGI